jgi:hypothetical protein
MRRALPLAAALCAIAAPSPAGELTPILDRADALEAAGQSADAVAALYEALDAALEDGPLFILENALVAEPAEGYGMYRPRADAVFAAGEPIHVYAVPMGYRYVMEDGRFRFGFATDFALRTQAGDVLAEQRDFGRFDFASLRRNRELLVNLTYRFEGLPPGAYEIETRVRDANGPGEASFATPFEIR